MQVLYSDGGMLYIDSASAPQKEHARSYFSNNEYRSELGSDLHTIEYNLNKETEFTSHNCYNGPQL